MQRTRDFKMRLLLPRPDPPRARVCVRSKEKRHTRGGKERVFGCNRSHTYARESISLVLALHYVTTSTEMSLARAPESVITIT